MLVSPDVQRLLRNYIKVTSFGKQTSSFLQMGWKTTTAVYAQGSLCQCFASTLNANELESTCICICLVVYVLYQSTEGRVKVGSVPAHFNRATNQVKYQGWKKLSLGGIYSSVVTGLRCNCPHQTFLHFCHLTCLISPASYH